MIKKSVVLKGTVVLVIFYVLAKILSFLIEMSIASNFGASILTDCYYLVDGIIALIGPMLSIGVWKVYMPEYKTLTVKGDIIKANRLTSSLIIVFLLLSLIISLFLFVFPAMIIRVFAPGFNDYAIRNSADILKILVFVFIISTITTFPSAILQSRSLFSKSQLKEIVIFIPPLVFLLLFGSKYGIIGYTYSVLLGYIIAFITQYYLLKPYYRFRFPKKIFTTDVCNLLKLYPVACLNAVINQLNTIVDKTFSSTLTVGSISYLNYGGKIIHLFDGVFSTAISVAMFPHLTEMYAKNDKVEFKGFLNKYLSLFSAVLFPVMTLLILASSEFVSLLFGYGKFDTSSVSITSQVLLMYAIGLPAMGLSTIINDVFYITKRIRILLYTTIMNVVCNVVLDYILMRYFGVAGLSLATTIALYISLFAKCFLIKDFILINRFFVYNFTFIFLGCIIGSVVAHQIISDTVNAYCLLVLKFILFILVYIAIIQFNNFYKKECLEVVMSLKKKIFGRI